MPNLLENLVLIVEASLTLLIISFIEALAKMPSYAKYLNKILSNKKKLKEFTTVPLTKECSTILQCKVPPNDPKSLSIPCNIVP